MKMYKVYVVDDKTNGAAPVDAEVYRENGMLHVIVGGVHLAIRGADPEEDDGK